MNVKSPMVIRKTINNYQDTFSRLNSNINNEMEDISTILDTYEQKVENIFEDNFNVFNGFYTIKTHFQKIKKPEEELKLKSLIKNKNRENVEKAISLLRKAIHKDDSNNLIKINKNNKYLSKASSINTLNNLTNISNFTTPLSNKTKNFNKLTQSALNINNTLSNRNFDTFSQADEFINSKKYLTTKKSLSSVKTDSISNLDSTNTLEPTILSINSFVSENEKNKTKERNGFSLDNKNMILKNEEKINQLILPNVSKIYPIHNDESKINYPTKSSHKKHLSFYSELTSHSRVIHKSTITTTESSLKNFLLSPTNQSKKLFCSTIMSSLKNDENNIENINKQIEKSTLTVNKQIKKIKAKIPIELKKEKALKNYDAAVVKNLFPRKKRILFFNRRGKDVIQTENLVEEKDFGYVLKDFVNREQKQKFKRICQENLVSKGLLEKKINKVCEKYKIKKLI